MKYKLPSTAAIFFCLFITGRGGGGGHGPLGPPGSAAGVLRPLSSSTPPFHLCGSPAQYMKLSGRELVYVYGQIMSPENSRVSNQTCTTSPPSPLPPPSVAPWLSTWKFLVESNSCSVCVWAARESGEFSCFWPDPGSCVPLISWINTPSR